MLGLPLTHKSRNKSLAHGSDQGAVRSQWHGDLFVYNKRMGLHLLDISNHDRDAAGLTYVYPVVSRRAGGVSVGINLNTNNACNWHCVYCQVPTLLHGVAPETDLDLLEKELRGFLDDVVNGGFMQARVPEDCRRLCDIAISGNGEPTSCAQFDKVVQRIIRVMDAMKLPPDVKLRLITNGSYVHRDHVQAGLRAMAEHKGEVWIKIDAGTEEGVRRINGVRLHIERLSAQLEAAAQLCPTWIQTCLFAFDGDGPIEAERQAYLALLKRLVGDRVPLEGVLLYGLARPSMQAEFSSHLSKLPEKEVIAFAERIRALGLEVRVSV